MYEANLAASVVSFKPSCVCGGILYLKLFGVGVINKITKLFIGRAEREIKRIGLASFRFT